MRSGGNNYNYFPENHLTKFNAESPYPFPLKMPKISSTRIWANYTSGPWRFGGKGPVGATAPFALY